MKYKLICTDMDGTLLNEQHEINEETKETLMEAHKKGIIIAITTGRLFASAKAYSDLIGFKTPIIASNGAYIRESDSDKCIFNSIFSNDEILMIYDIIKKNNLSSIFYTHNAAISEKPLPPNHPYIANNKVLSLNNRIEFCIGKDILQSFKKYDGEISKVICIENDVNKHDTLFKVKDELKSMGCFEVVSSGPNNFEVMKKGTSKGNAVKELALSLNIKRDEIICLGDNENDLSMIKYAGLGIAMGNACELLKKEADYITDTNINSGVAKAIKKWCFEE